MNTDFQACQGDLRIRQLSAADVARLSETEIIRPAKRGSIRLLEGEVTGHHHEIVMERPGGDMDGVSAQQEAEAIAVTQIALAKAKAKAQRGTAVLYDDMGLARSLKWLLRTDLMIGFLKVEGGPVMLIHPEHDPIKLPIGVFYVGRQIESAGADERRVAD